MARYSKHHYRALAIQRRRDPEQDQRNAEASAAMVARVNARLAASPLIQRLQAEAEAAAQRLTV